MLRRTRGVTLIELAVALTVLGLVMLALMPSVGVWMRNTQVRNTASSILTGLQTARNEAIRRNAAIRFSLVSLTDPSVLDNSCALSSTGVSWVVSVRDPASHCADLPVSIADQAGYGAAVAVATNPLIVDANAGGVGGRNVVVCANVTDGSAAADTVVFNGFGRVEGAAPIGFIDINNETLGNDYRRLRIEVSPGGSVRMCDMAVTATTDSRYCQIQTACS
jgi:type IV fimbrial biogenesis protein FimT